MRYDEQLIFNLSKKLTAFLNRFFTTRLVEFTSPIISAIFSGVRIVPLIKGSVLLTVMVRFWAVWIIASFVSSWSVPIWIQNSHKWSLGWLYGNRESPGQTNHHIQSFHAHKWNKRSNVNVYNRWTITAKRNKWICNRFGHKLIIKFFLRISLASVVIFAI